jgi:SOS-response transcriptional repressor LexA
VVRIPVFGDALGAGPGQQARDDVVAYGRFFRRWLRREVRVQPDRTFIAPIQGRSMEDLLQDGDLVLCERVEEIEYDDIYVCRLNGEMKVKHAFRSNGGVVLKSENDRYPTIEVGPDDDFAVIGRVARRIVR